VRRWVDLADVEKDFDGLVNLIVREQYLGVVQYSHIFKGEEAKGFE